MSKSVANFYDQNPQAEWERLELPLCRIEFRSTWRLIEKYFPTAPHVIDVGGGPGRYAIELLKRGYAVTLVDISEQEVRMAERLASESGLAGVFTVGDARALDDFEDEHFDAALFLGPMYHIVDAAERASALRELRRVLKPNGLAIIAYLNSWGLIKTGIADFPTRYQEIENLRCMLEENKFPEGELSSFTESFWSTPASAARELGAAGFLIETYAGAEGFANGMSGSLETLRDDNPTAFENVVEFAAETSELPQYRDTTDHIHFVARKPNDQ